MTNEKSISVFLFPTMVRVCLAFNRSLITLFFTLLLSQAVYSQSLPKCIEPCISSSATDAKCPENDFTCMCKIPLFSWTVVNCSRLYCPLETQTTAEGIIDKLCGTDENKDTSVPTPTSPFPIFTFSDSLAQPSTITSSSAGQSTAVSSPSYATTGISISISNTSTSESGKNKNTSSDSENTTSPQPLNSGTSALSGYGLNNGRRLLGWLAVVGLLVIAL